MKVLLSGRDDAAGVDRVDAVAAVVKVVPLAVRVPATTISADEQQLLFKVTVSPLAKLRVPLSVSVCPGGNWTGTLVPTFSVAPDATVKPPGKT